MEGNTTTINKTIHCHFLPDHLSWHPSISNDAIQIISMAAVVINGISAPLTVLLNACLIINISMKPNLRQKESVVAVLFLSVSDLLNGLISQPLFISRELSHQNTDLAEPYCNIDQVLRSIIDILSVSSFLHLVVVVYERYVAIEQPFLYATKINVRRLGYTSVGIWILSVVCITAYEISQQYFSLCPTCVETVLVIILFIIPLPLVVYWYFKIFLVFRQTQIRILKAQASFQSKAAYNNQVRHQRKSTFTTVIISCGFLIAYLPTYLIVIPIYFFGPEKLQNKVHFMFGPILQTLIFLNSLWNPIVLCLRTSDLKRECRKVFGLTSNGETVFVTDKPRNNVGNVQEYPQHLEMQTLPQSSNNIEH